MVGTRGGGKPRETRVQAHPAYKPFWCYMGLLLRAHALATTRVRRVTVSWPALAGFPVGYFIAGWSL